MVGEDEEMIYRGITSKHCCIPQLYISLTQLFQDRGRTGFETYFRFSNPDGTEAVQFLHYHKIPLRDFLRR